MTSVLNPEALDEVCGGTVRGTMSPRPSADERALALMLQPAPPGFAPAPAPAVVQLAHCVVCGREMYARAPRAVCSVNPACREAWAAYLRTRHPGNPIDTEVVTLAGKRPRRTRGNGFRHMTTRDPIRMATPGAWRRP